MSKTYTCIINTCTCRQCISRAVVGTREPKQSGCCGHVMPQTMQAPDYGDDGGVVLTLRDLPRVCDETSRLIVAARNQPAMRVVLEKNACAQFHRQEFTGGGGQ